MIRFSSEDVLRFADWSGDRNPLHVDDGFARRTYFGRRVVHGVLTVLESLSTAPSPLSPIAGIDVEFRGAVFIGETYRTAARRDGADDVFTVENDSHSVLSIRCESGPAGVAPSSFSWTGEPIAAEIRETPVRRGIDELARGVDVIGAYDAAPPTDSHPGGVSDTHARVLALCSYVTGMELPGLHSLFTRVTLRFHGDAHGAALRYRARALSFDRAFRMLETELEVATADGRPVATGVIQSYVPLSPAAVDLPRLEASLGGTRLGGTVALVVGGTRGLGADIGAALALAGCHVYAGGRTDDDDRRELEAVLRARGCVLELLQGDAADPAWCASAAAAIGARHGRLDVLVLNACAPPQALRVGIESADARERYIRENLRLVEAPLNACASLLEASGGAIACISSSFVQDTPPGFGHYAALKQAAEAITRTVVRERPRLASLIARPPVLQTRWNDTPSAVAGSIPSIAAASRIVQGLATCRPGEVHDVTEFTAPAVHDVAPVPAPADISVRVAASFTADPLLPALEFWMKELAIGAALELAPYGQVLQSLLDPGSALNARRRGINVVLLRVADWLHELGDDAEDLERVGPYLQQTAADFERAVRTHRGGAGAETLLIVCPSHGVSSAGVRAIVRRTESELMASLAGVPGLHVVSAAEYHARYRVDDERIYDELRDEIAHIPYQDDYLQVLATIVARQVSRRFTPPRKVVVVDCDNTLWRGVVGEVGAEGIQLDESHRALHVTLARLAASGVLVCLCSKNEEADVWGAFDARPDFGVRRDQIVAAAINWLPKSQNLRTLAARLNLGLDSFVFIDDNPVECAEVRAGCPEVLTLEWPHDPERARRLLDHTWELDAASGTNEDARRTELYREELKRQELRAEALTFSDFIDSLQLEVDFAPLGPEDIRRASQLTLRTNQFNFTTIRRDEAELQALAAGGRHQIRVVRVRDRFGDYGLVGLVIAECGADVWTLDTFLLSCRVLGRGAEHRILADLGRMAENAGARTVRLVIESTKRNTPARSFLESVVDPSHRRVDGGRIECDVPAAELAAVHFDPSSAGEVVVQEESGSRPASRGPMDGTTLRRREEQIARAAFHLATGAELRSAIQGRPLAATGAHEQAGDIAGTVHDAFAAALRIPVSRVAEVDGLEALGCSSMRIVEITVSLRARYPWLPSTLLFEHRSVSGIVEEIARLARASGRAAGETREAVHPVGSSVVQTETGVGAAAVDLAVVGMGVRCAGASSPGELWDLLSEGRSAVAPVPTDRRFFLRPLVDDRPHWAGLLDEVARFDAALFGVSPREAEQMDPQLRLFLEVAWSALEDAGLLGSGFDPQTGVFAGVMYGDYGATANHETGAKTPYRCWEGFSLANRLSHLLGFHGPSLAVDTACSSSATALHLACASLRAGECRVAIVGGVNLILDPDRFASLGRLGILSTRGRCEPFGADADGTVLGEGAGVVVLRPLDEALRRGDRVYGVIKGSGVSTGSGTVGFTAPNPQAQAQAVRSGLRAARVDPRTISYVETHGTGTSLGDPIEVRGLALGYGPDELYDPGRPVAQQCTIGSIKPNIGHLEAGAGVLALIKVLLQIERRMLLPSITSSAPNPQIPFAETPFDVQRGLAPWVRPVVQVNGRSVEVPRRAGVSSFGVGGANVHVIVEEPPQNGTGRASGLPGGPVAGTAIAVERPVHVLALSARDEESLRELASQVRDHVTRYGDVEPADLCFSVNTGRKHFEHRLAVAAGSRDELVRALGAGAAGREPQGGALGRAPIPAPKIAFLFTGQGSQYAGMGAQLYDTQPVYRDAIDACAATLDVLLERPLREVLFADPGAPQAELLTQTGYTQPALFAMQYALAALWKSWGVQPAAVMGHSVGEIAAMCVAGGLSLEDGLTLIAARGRLMQALPAGGLMTSVMADEARVLEALAGSEEHVAIAAINAPGQVVISGVGAVVEEIAARLSADGIRTRPLVVSHAFHSPLMKPMLAEYERVVRTIRFTAPRIPLVSCVDGVIAGEAMTRPEYWLRQVMEPVRFTTGAACLEAEGVEAYVEIGPHPVLLGMARQCAGEDAVRDWLPSMRRDVDPWRTIAGSLARLYTRGVEIDWSGFDAPYARRRVTAPAYAFTGRRYWLRDVASRAAASSARSAVVPPVVPDITSSTGKRGPAAYEISWVRAATAAPRGALAAADHWMLIADRGGVAEALAGQLRASGATVELVDDVPADAAAVARLWSSASGAQTRRVVYLQGLDIRDPHGAARGAADVVQLVQTVSGRSVTEPCIWVVTQGAVAAGDEASHGPLALAQAPLWGLARTVSLEHPELWGAAIDIAPGDVRAAGAALARELLRGDAVEDQVALRGDERFVPRLVSARLPDASGSRTLNGTGTYLVTGGLGALGLHTARWLVARGARRLVLASRRGATSDAARAALAELAKPGVDIDVVEADISKADDVDVLLGRAHSAVSPLRGIVHAAGVDAVVPVRALTEADVETVFGAKVLGGWLLHERTKGLPLELFVCFSSISAVLGSQGRAHYAAANAFLDGLAVERRRLGLAALSIDWGPWTGGGMASSEHLQQLERIGNSGLDPRDAINALSAAMESGRAQVVVADIDWATFRPVFEARRPRPILAALSSALDEQRAQVRTQVATEDPGRDGAADRRADAPWIATLAAVPASEREGAATALLRREVAETLGFDDVESVPLDRSLYDVGVDSLMMAELVARLKARVGFSCSALVFDHPQVRSLASALVERAFPAGEEGREASRPEGSGGHDARRPLSRGPVRLTEGYSPDVECEVFDFQAQAWKRRDSALIPARWRWMYVESARRLGVKPAVWLHRDEGRIVAHMGSIPVRLKMGAGERDTGWLVDTMVTSEYRNRALGSQIMIDAHEDQPFSLSLGQTTEMREIQLRLGWKQVAPLQIARLLVRPERVLKGKLPAPAAWAAGLGLRASSALRDLLGERRSLEAREVERFDERHDRLWACMSRDVTCAVVRDASYLNWKYVDQPGQRFLRLELADANRVVAVAVWMFREPDAHYRYRRAYLVDFVGPIADPALLQHAIRSACAAAVERGADALLCLHTDERLTDALRTSGFHLRKPERFLLVDPGPLPADELDLVLTGRNWYLTQGDSDIDRPW